MHEMHLFILIGTTKKDGPRTIETECEEVKSINNK